MKILVAYISLFWMFIPNVSYTQVDIKWKNNFGESGHEWPHEILQTNDGNYVIAGVAITEENGILDGWVFKINPEGNILWSKYYGGSGVDVFYDMELGNNDEILLFGTSGSLDGNLTNLGGWDYWLVQIDQQGNLINEKIFGGSRSDAGYKILLSKEGGYILGGMTNSNLPNSIDQKMYVVKINEDLEIEWENVYGGSRKEEGFDIIQLDDESYIIGGRTKSYDGDVSENDGSSKYWVIKIDPLGNLLWEKTIPTHNDTWDLTLALADNNSIIVSGTNETFDFMILNLSPEGNIIWEKTYGGSGEEELYHILKSSDGGYFLGGGSYSNDGDVSQNLGESDVWFMRIDNNGDIIWQYSMGGTLYENSTAILEIENDCYLVTMGSYSSDYDFPTNNGDADVWIVKFCEDIDICIDNDDLDIEITGENLSCESNQSQLLVSANYLIDSIIWSGPQVSNFNTNSLEVTAGGEYIANVFSGECSILTSIIIEDIPNFVDLEYTLCEGEFVNINGEQFDESGNYEIFVSGIECDTLFSLAILVLDLTRDTTTLSICEGDDYLGYTQTGTYTDTITPQTGCKEIRVLNLTIDPEIYLSEDVIICEGESFNGYNETNIFIDTIQNLMGCDTITEINLTVLPSSESNQLVVLCPGQEYEFDGTVIESGGLYSSIEENFYGCDSIINIEIEFIEETEFLGPNVELCNEQKFLIQSPHSNTLWPDGSISNSFQSTSSGTYIAEFIDDNGCTQVDSININLGSSTIFIPNIFFPNGDGSNDVFQPILTSYQLDDIKSYDFNIYDRWGNHIFQSSTYYPEQNSAWNGTYNGVRVSQGVYVYQLSITFSDCNYQKTGDVTLVR